MIELNTHFQKYKEHLFFEEKTYDDLTQMAARFFPLIKNEKEFVALKFKSPFLSFAAQLAAFAAGKKAVLISALETNQSVEHLQKQVPFKTILTDETVLHEKKTPLVFPELNGNDIALIVSSSGSTGTPKGIALTFNNLFFSVKGFTEYFNMSEDDVSLMNLPHHHVGGLMTLWRSFLSGGSLINTPSKKFDIISVVPLQLARVLNDETEINKLRTCRIILVGGAKLTPELRLKAEEKRLALYETYGMSESTSLVCINGEVLPYREISLDSDHFFLIKGATLSPGYYREGVFHPLLLNTNGWYKTNDKGSSENGRFIFSHRDDLVFISGGENINPLIIEEALRTHPKIKDAYVLPVDDERWGEMGIALFDSNEHLNEAELKQFLKTKIHPHHIPKHFFQAQLQFEGALKPKRNDLKKKAEELYLKNLFSFSFIETKGAPLIVFFHGFTGRKEDFVSLGESFKDNFSLLFIDLPGHGNTKAEDFFSTSDVLKKISAFIRLFSDRPIYYGYSMGGRVALQLALHYLTPEKLVLESAGPGLISNEEADERRKRDLSMFDAYSSSKDFLLHWYKNDLFKNYQHAQSFHEDVEKKSHHDLSEWKKSQSFLSQGCFPLMRDNLGELKTAPLQLYYLYGSEDQKYKAYADLYRHSIAVEGASHNPHKTHLPEITAILKTILK